MGIEELLEKRGVVFIEPSDYIVAEGPFKGKIFSGVSSTDAIGEEDRKIVVHLTQIGVNKLYKEDLPEVKGRVVPTGNKGEGAGGVDGKLYYFKEE